MIIEKLRKKQTPEERVLWQGGSWSLITAWKMVVSSERVDRVLKWEPERERDCAYK